MHASFNAEYESNNVKIDVLLTRYDVNMSHFSTHLAALSYTALISEAHQSRNTERYFSLPVYRNIPVLCNGLAETSMCLLMMLSFTLNWHDNEF